MVMFSHKQFKSSRILDITLIRPNIELIKDKFNNLTRYIIALRLQGF